MVHFLVAIAYLQSWMKSVIKSILENEWNNTPKAYRLIRDELTVSEGIILRQLRIVIPEILRERCLELVHKNHMGIVRCKESLRSKV